MKKLVILILCSFLFACGGSDGNNYSDSNSPEIENVKITYSVSSYSENCYDAAYVYYLVPGVDYYDLKVSLPWSCSFYARPGDCLYLYATPAHIADLECVPEHDLNLAIEKDDTILLQGITTADDPNTYDINTYP